MAAGAAAARAFEGVTECAPHPAHAPSHACVRARYTGACRLHVPMMQQWRCLCRRERSCRERERESSRERPAGDGAGRSSSEAGRAHAGDGGDMSPCTYHVTALGRSGAYAPSKSVACITLGSSGQSVNHAIHVVLQLRRCRCVPLTPPAHARALLLPLADCFGPVQ